MEIFRLFGRILVENDDANRKIQDTDERAAKVGTTLANGIRTAARWGAGIAAAAGAAGGALLALANRTAQASDQLVVNAQRAGTTTTSFQEMRYALTQVGVAESDVSMALQRLNQRVGQAEEGSSKYSQALDRLRVSTRNANGEIKTSDELFMELVTRLHAVEDSQTRAALAADIFGVNLAQRVLPAIEAGGDALADLRNRAHEIGVVLEDEGLQAGAEFASMMDDVRMVLGSLTQRIMVSVMPTLKQWLEWTADNLPKLGPIFQFVGEVVEIVVRHTSRALEPWVELIGSILGVAWDWTVNLLGDAWDWLVNTTWAEKWDDIKRWLTAGWYWTIDIAGTAWAWLRDTTWEEKVEDIRSWLSAAWTWTVNLAGRFWSWLDERAPWATEAIRTIRDWLLVGWEWSVELAGRFWSWLDDRAPWLTEFLETVWEFLVRGWTWTIDTLGSAWHWLTTTTWTENVEDVKSWLSVPWEWVIGIAGAAWTWLTETTWADKLDDIRGWLSSAWTWTVDMAGRAWGWLEEHAPWLTSTLETLWGYVTRAWEWTVELVGDAWEWLRDTLWESAATGMRTAWEFIANLLGPVWDWLRDTAWPVISEGAKTAWSFSVDLLGRLWGWIRDTAWPVISSGAKTAWAFSLDLAGRVWEWLRDTAWPIVSAGAKTAWAFSVELAGQLWDWLRGTAWPVISSGAKTAWAFGLELVGDLWDWLRDVAWPIITQGASTAWDWTMDAAGAAWEWIAQDGWRDTVAGIQSGFQDVQNRVIGAVTGMVQGVSTWFNAMRNSVSLHVTDIVSSVVRWFATLRDSGIAYVQGLVEGIKEWFSESKLGKAWDFMLGLWDAVTEGARDMYIAVVGQSYVPDMVEEIGEAVERLKDRLANPVARYTASVIESFEYMEEEVAASMMRMAEAMDKVLDDMVNRVARAIGDITRSFWNGTATWAGLLHSFADAIGGIFGSIFDAIAKELVKNILTQNTWLVQTLSNIATAITGFLSQAYATLVAFFAWSGPLAPVLAGGVIAAAIAGIASLAGSAIRGMLPDAPSPGGGTGYVGADRGPASGGRQVSEIAGPTRDLLTDLLTPLASLNTLTGIGERIYGLLDERLPVPVPGMAMAGVGPGVTVNVSPGAVQIVGAPGDSPDIDVDELAERLAQKIAFELRGTGR